MARARSSDGSEDRARFVLVAEGRHVGFAAPAR